MKKAITVILTVALTVLMVLSMVGCDMSDIGGQISSYASKLSGGETEIDTNELQQKYDDIIDSFVGSALNTFEMTVGDTHSPNATVWLKTGNGSVYSSDESVVTVTELGKVTAVGEGSAYVIIMADKTGNSLYEIYRYDVYNTAPEANLSNLPAIDGIDFANEIANFNSTALNTTTLKVGASHSPTASVWASNGGTCYTSDETVVTVAANGNVTAVGRGTAYVIIKAGIGNMFEIYKYVVNG